MSITFVAVARTAANTNVVKLPVCAAGDTLLVLLPVEQYVSAFGGIVDFGPASGWTKLTSAPASPANYTVTAYLFTKVATAGDSGGTATFPQISGSSYQAFSPLSVAYRGATLVFGALASSTLLSGGAMVPPTGSQTAPCVVGLGAGSSGVMYSAQGNVRSSNAGDSSYIADWLGTSGKYAGPTGQLSSYGSPNYGAAVTVLLSNASAPAAATLSSPANASYIDSAAAGAAFTSTYTSTDGANCNAYCLRIKASGAGSYSYWNAGTAALQSTPVWNPCSVTPGSTLTVTVPAGVLADGTTYNWSIANQEASGNLQGPFASDFTFVGNTAPSLAITGRTGSVTDTSQPTTSWTTTPAAGGAQTGWQVIWETGAYGTAPGSGTVAAALSGTDNSQSAQVPTALTNGTTYRQFVQVTETGGQTSTWQHADMTLALTPPGTPTLTATAGTDPVTGAPRVVLAVTGHDAGGFTYANTVYEVQSSPDGTTWADVRGATALTPSSSDTATVSDYEAPMGQVRYYRGRTIGMTGGNIIATVWSAVQTATPPAVDWWLSDPADPTAAVPAHQDPATFAALHGRNVGAFQALGRRNPIVVSDSTIGGRSGTLNVATFGAANWTSLNSILDRLTTLLLRSPFGDVLYLQIASTSTGANFGWTDTFSLGQHRDVSVPFVEVDRP